MRYLEDLPAGLTLDLGEVIVDAEEMVAFARRFDPQPFHIDPVAAAQTHFGGLIASGWFTAGLFNRLLVDAFMGDVANLGGLGIDQLRFEHPVRAGDVLSADLVVSESRPSERKRDRGTVTTAGTMCNQAGVTVLSMISRFRAQRRPCLS